MPAMIRVAAKTHKQIAVMADTLGVPMAEIVRVAVERYRRELIVDEMNKDYAALRADADVWAEVQHERREMGL
jgi:fructose-1,6-bisphosphatase/sedoheptulose 1,7-bisphosphatase-like protein